MGPKMEVSRISWEHLRAGKETGQDTQYIVYKGKLQLPGGPVPVVYKVGREQFKMTTHDFMDEARVLLALYGMAEVPRLYGVTTTDPLALVMSQSHGTPLRKFQRSATALTYLSSLREVCLILGRIHHRGVAHCDISDLNILVKAKGNTEDVAVSLVGFDHAVFPEDKEVFKVDCKQLLDLVHVMGDKLNKSSVLFQNRDKLLVEKELNLTGILRLLCSVLHNENPFQCEQCRKLFPGN